MSTALAVTVATAAFLSATYSSLPYGVPVRFVEGTALIYQVKSPMLVMLPAIVQVALLAIFSALVLILLRRTAADGRQVALAAEGVALLAAVWVGVQSLSALRLVSLWQRGSGDFGGIYTIALIIAVAISLVIGRRTMKLVRREPRGAAPLHPRRVAPLAATLMIGAAFPYFLARLVLRLGD